MKFPPLVVERERDDSMKTKTNIEKGTPELTKSQQLLYCIIDKTNGVDDKTKLAKLEYFSDFIHYAFHDEAISDEIYTRQKQGPLGRHLTDDLNILTELGYVEENPKYHYKIKKPLGTSLDSNETKTIEFVVDRYGKLSWGELMSISHEQIPYLSARDGEIIESFTAYNLVDEYPEYATQEMIYAD